MSTTTNGSGPAPAAAHPAAARPMPTAPPLAAPRTRRRPGLYALGTALVVVGALAAVWLVNSSSARVPVLALARQVAQGDALTRADLAVTDVSHDPSVRTVPADQASEMVGKVAATTLTEGSLLAPGQVTAVGPPGDGQVLVPLSMPGARLPVGGLHAEDRILVVDTPPADADVPNTAPATIPARVVRVGRSDLNDVTVIDVTVATGDGPALAVRAATGRFALVVEPAGD